MLKKKGQARLTHTDADGRARMVDVTDKATTVRRAVAWAEVHASKSTVKLIRDNAIAKGDVLTVAELAGIQAAKRTSDLIPLAHPISLTHVTVKCKPVLSRSVIEIEATAKCSEGTGVEMEAMTAATVAALTIYDMAKGVDRGMTISAVRLVEKSGGRSGHWKRG